MWPRKELLPCLHLVKLDVTLDPVAIGALGSDGVMPDSEHFPDLVHQFELGVGNDQFRQGLSGRGPQAF